MALWFYLITCLFLFRVIADSPLNNAQTDPFYPTPYGARTTDPKWSIAYQRASAIVRQMTLAEKVNLTSGVGWGMGYCVGNSGPVERLGVPSICYQDGPLGVRFSEHSTAFPCGMAAAATFNKALIADRAKAIALEHKAHGVDVMLGPVSGPLGLKGAGGRAFEGFGSDPYLSGVAAAVSVEAIQAQGIMANAKHFIGNEQEHYRQYTSAETPPISSNIDDRALHETFGWPFQDMVRAGVASVMCSYNRVNNTLACQNPHLLNNILKSEYGFPGLVVSDWEAQLSGVDSVLAGIDVDMPGSGLGSSFFGTLNGVSYMGYNLAIGVLNGTIPLDRVDDMATRVMAAYYYVGLDKDKEKINFSSWSTDTEGPIYSGAKDSPIGHINDHVNIQTFFSRNVSLNVALESTVLVKNDKVLPFQLAPIDTEQPQPSNNGTGIRRIGIFGNSAKSNPNGANAISDKGFSDGVLVSGWGSGSVNAPYARSGADSIEKYAIQYGLEVDHNFEEGWHGFSSGFNLLAQHTDVNVIFATTDSGEGYITVDENHGDRNNFSLWHNADVVIGNIAEVSSNNVVVINTVGPINVEKWINHPNITAVILTPPQGQDTGEAIAQVLFGIYNPSGRLPFTVAKDDTDYVPVIYNAPKGSDIQDNFDTGIYIDYKLFEKRGIVPRFEFGFGLSYSNFVLSNPTVIRLAFPSRDLPYPRNYRQVSLPYNSTVPSPEELLYPSGFHSYSNYIYPYISSTEQAIPTGTFSYPTGYFSTQTTTARLHWRDVSEDVAPTATWNGTVPLESGGAPSATGSAVITSAPGPSCANDAANGDTHGRLSSGASHSVSATQPSPQLQQLPIPRAGGGVGGNPALWQNMFRVRVAVKNNGPFDGATVVQLYLGIPSTELDTPVHQLRGFEKIALPDGQRSIVEFYLTRRDISVWSVAEQSWIISRGQYTVTISTAGPNDPNAVVTTFTV